MNRVSDAIVRRDPDPEDFFVIDKTNAAKIDQDRLNRALGVARVVETNPGLQDDLSSFSSLSKFESIISNTRSQASKKFVPKEGSGLLTLKEKIERQKATRSIVPQLDCANANPKALTRKVATTSGPSKYLGFNTDGRDSTPKKSTLSGKPSSTIHQKSSNSTLKKTVVTEVNTTTTRKTSKPAKPTITTSSWRDSQKKAREILKNETPKRERNTERSKSAEVKSICGSVKSSSKDTSKTSLLKEDAELYKDLSPEVQAIVADLKLDEPASKEKPVKMDDATKMDRRARSYTPKRPARRKKSPSPEPTPKKKHNYDQAEIQEYMRKKKQERLKANENKAKQKQEKQAKIDAQLKSLREAQMSNAKSKVKAKSRGHSADAAKSLEMDSVAKAMQIINELDEKDKRAKSAKMANISRRPKSAPPKKTSKPKAVDDPPKEAVGIPPKLNLSSSRNSIVSIEKLSIPAASGKASPKSTPREKSHTPRSEISDGSRSEKAKSILGFIQSSIDNLDFHNPNRPPLAETQEKTQPKPKRTPQNPKHSALLKNLKAKSDNINKLTDAWESKLEDMVEKREQEHAFDMANPPGVKSLDKLVENTMQERLISTDSLENQAKMPEPVQTVGIAVDLPVYKPAESSSSVENLPPMDFNPDIGPIKKSSSRKRSPKKTRKPVKFARSSSPDEFNMVDLMFREEQARRKAMKIKKRESELSKKSHKTSSVLESDGADSYSDAKFSLASSGKEVVSEIVTPRSQVITSRSDGLSTRSTASLRSGSDALVSTSSKSNQSKTNSHTASINETSAPVRSDKPATSVSESITETLSSLAAKKTASESDTAQLSEEKYSSFSETDRVTTVYQGEALKNALTSHLKLSEGIDENIRALDEAKAKMFLDEMREIQQKGAKAAELMLKASKNFVKGSRIDIRDDDPTSTDVTPTRTSTRTGMIDEELSIQSEPQYTPIRATDPSYSEVFSSHSEVTTTQQLPTPSISAVKTQSISEITKSQAPITIDETSTVTSTTATPVSQTSTIVTVPTSKKTEDVTSSSTTVNEESYASTFDDLNESAKLLTPSMEYRKKIPDEIRKRLPSEASDVSTDLDTSGYDAFTNFMADMVRQYVSNEKSSREKFHKAMMQAKEQAIREKKKKKIPESDPKRKSKKGRGADDKMPTKEQLEHSITLSESDTSTSTINRVKKWFAIDEKHLTQRENQLQKRRKKAEKLLAWKEHLDEQEKSILEIEQDVAQAIAKRKISNESEISQAESAATDTFNATSETDMDSSDHEARLKALHGQCREKEKIVAKLRRTLKKHAGSKKQELKAQEAAVQKQIESLDVMIAKAKEQLEFIENNKEIIVKPIIKSPQSSQVVDRPIDRSVSSPAIPLIASLPKDASPFTSPRSSRSSSESESQQKTLRSESETISEIVTESIKDSQSVSVSQSQSIASNSIDLKSHSEPLISLGEEKAFDLVSQFSESRSATSPSESDTVTSVATVTAPVTESVATAPQNTPPVKSEDPCLNDFLPAAEEEEDEDVPPTKNASILANTGDEMAKKMIEEIIGKLSGQEKETIRENLRAQDFAQADDLSEHSNDSDDSLTDALLETRPKDLELNEIEPDLECDEVLETSGDGEVFNYFQHYKVEQEQKLSTEEVLERADGIADMVNNNPGVPPIHQDEFDEALYDVCQEIAFDLHLSGTESKGAILNQLSQYISPNGPDLDRHIVEKMGRRSKKDRVDRLLIAELRQDEKNWIDYSKDEMSVRDEVTNSILNYLLDDTVQALKERYSVAV
ncbi:Oidioi.mRNA.OKI2018_I69.chr1.g2504.t1.cds [Oikopleura dioica]|uniref:Oidioi.mRNA.OKI2018_I69.chr1.g2504.t1.cds n=1 Tax=Oikopleura dioica TaxID=34765 RepID=A0ABN7SWN6_OIKDI|nr:Oidioi.mRNA.OKI2018_I69.chr1.g2504.t1.cds [Oikopleura dioica]